jgi:hypothetical protein
VRLFQSSGPCCGAVTTICPRLRVTALTMRAESPHPQPGGGADIHVTSVIDSAGQLIIGVASVVPDSTCMTTPALTQPVDVVAIPRRGVRSWTFTEQKRTRGC